MTIPNFITIARLIGVPLIVWLMIADRFLAAALLFILAGLSDAADGFIAKRFHASSELGAYLDPVADKALLVSVFVTLGFKGALPAWLIVLVVSRDLFIIGAMLLAYVLEQPDGGAPALGLQGEHRGADRPHCLRSRRALGLSEFAPLIVADRALAVAVLTVASAGAYLVEWLRHMAGGPGDAGAGTP